VLAVVALFAGVWVHHSASRTSRGSDPPAVGAVAWPFQGTASVAVAHQADAAASFDTIAGEFVAEAIAEGRIGVHVGQPHALLATRYLWRSLDVVVVVAPVIGGGRVTGLAGFYVSDSDHQGVDAVMTLGSGDPAVSGTVRSYINGDLDEATIVVGGPRAGGLLVAVDGRNTAIGQIQGNQTAFDSRGISWMYPAIAAGTQSGGDGNLTITDGQGDTEHALYVGPPAARPTWS
jgi:hypothetical protein